MKRKFQAILVTMIMVISLSMTAMAAEWKQNDTGWWYQEDDGSYPVNTWKWIGDKCYYFDSNGYMLSNTVTPDGYTVDESGAWLQDVPKVEPVQNKVEAPTSKDYVGEIAGYIYIPGYGYVDMSNAAGAVNDHPEYNNSYDKLTGEQIGTMN